MGVTNRIARQVCQDSELAYVVPRSPTGGGKAWEEGVSAHT